MPDRLRDRGTTTLSNLRLRLRIRKSKLGLSGRAVSNIDKVVYRNSPGVNINTTVSDLTLTTYQATIPVTTNLAELILTTYPVDIVYGANVETNVHNLIITENQASIFYDPVIESNVHNLALTTNQVSLSIGEEANEWFNSYWWKTPTFGTTWWPDASGDTEFTTIVHNLNITTYKADVQPQISEIFTNPHDLVLTEYQALIDITGDIAAIVHDLVLTTNQATILADRIIDTTVVDLALTAYQAAIELSKPIEATVVNLSLTSYNTNITTDREVFANTVNLTISTLEAVIIPTRMAVQFNRPFTFTDGTLGVEFIKDLGLPSEVTKVPTEATDWGSNVMEYVVETNAGVGETMHYKYISASGDMEDTTTGRPMANVQIQLINCKEV